MLFQYAQNYALNYAPNLPTMLKLCPLFLKYNCTLLCTTSQFHHQSQTRSRSLLGDLPADDTDHTLAIMWRLDHRVGLQACMGRDTS